MNNKKLILTTSIIVALLGIGFVTALVIDRTSNNSTQAPTGPTQEEKQQESAQNADTKKDIIEKPDQAREPADTTDDINKNIDLTAKQENDGTVTVFTKLYGYSAGSCELTINSNGSEYNDNATIIYQPEFSSCAGFSVPVSSLGAGSWLITLTTNSNNQIAEEQLSFEVN